MFSFLVLAVASEISGSSVSTIAVERVDATQGIQVNAGFKFTVAPNDRWMVFFARNEGDDHVDIDGTYGLLRIVDLKTNILHRLTVSEADAPQLMENVDIAWSSDSSLCVLPPPPDKGRRVVIRFSDPEEPSLAFIPERPRPTKPGEAAPDAIALPERFTCSDCSPRSIDDDVALMRKLIPLEHQFQGTVLPDHTAQVVSHDGGKVYYQRGPQAKSRDATAPANLETTLYEIDVKTGQERMLVNHQGACARIEHLRPSPDGRRLAYTVTDGCGFVSVPEIFVLELDTGKTESIARGGGPMHWSSTSDRLYFYRRWEKQAEHGDYVWYAEFAKPRKQPATRPGPAATAPAKGGRTP